MVASGMLLAIPPGRQITSISDPSSRSRTSMEKAMCSFKIRCGLGDIVINGLQSLTSQLQSSDPM